MLSSLPHPFLPDAPHDDSDLGFSPRCMSCLLPMVERHTARSAHWQCPSCGHLRIS
jgi:predicted RNA-binding Zn-ribbon protein involved in translation (DUF1610 family)